jgi:phospholipid/cholesterol/gamma-HCH transport system substrate-binding protein
MVAGTSEGLAVGMAVRLSGFRIGKVSSVSLDAPGRVRVACQVFREYMPYLRRDSSALVRGENIIGDRFIEVAAGSAGASELGDDDLLELKSEPTIGAMVDAFREEVRPVLNQLGEIAKYLADPEGDLKKSMGNIRSLTGTLDKELAPTLTASRSTVTELDSLAKNLEDENGPLKKSLAGLEKASRTLAEELPPLVERFDHSLVQFDEAATSATKMLDHADVVIGKIETVVDKTGPEVPGIVQQGTSTMKKADEVVSSVRNMWPVRGGVPKAKEKTLKPNSHD